MDAEEGPLLDLADAILEDVAVDWEVLSSDTPGSDRALIGEFRAIQAIGRFHRRPAAAPLVDLSGRQWGPRRWQQHRPRQLWRRVPGLRRNARS